MEKDQGRAGQLLQEALHTNPDDPEANALRAVLFMMQAQYEMAIQYLEKAKQLNPNLEMIYYNLAKSYRKTNQLQQAESAARQALAFNPGNFQAHAELSCTLFKTARAKEAIDHLMEAIHINPAFLKAYLIMGQLFRTSGSVADALVWYRNALRHLPEAHVLREQLCDLYERSGDTNSAYKEAAELAAQRSLSSDYVRAGNYARMIGSLDAAAAAFQKARELNPGGVYEN